jgi:hypothetical protein
MQWKCYELIVNGKTWAREDCKLLQLQYNESTTKCFLDYLKPKLSKFILHKYVAHFQKEQYKICLQTFLETSIMHVVDFVENYMSTFTTKYTRDALALNSTYNINSYLL